MSKNDITCLKGWKYLDYTVYSKEKMEGIMAIREAEKPSIIKEVPRILKGFGQLFNANIYLYVLVVMMLWGIWKLKALERVLMIGVGGIGCAELAYLLLVNRCIEHSALIPILAMFVFILYLSEKDQPTDNNKIVAGILCLCSFCMFCFSDVPKITRYATPLEGITTEVYNVLSSQQNYLFVWDPLVDAAMCNLGYLPIEPFPQNGHSNSVIMGGWLALSPCMGDISERFGERANVYKLLAENDNVFYVSSEGIYCDVIEIYIQEHYNKNARCIQVGDVYGFGIYTFKEVEIVE